MEENVCPICQSSPSENIGRSGDPFIYVECQRCGKFNIGTQVVEDISSYLKNESRDRALLSHWIRKGQGKNPFKISYDNFKSILENNTLPKVKEQADNFILWLASKSKFPGDIVNEIGNNLCAIVGCETLENIDYIIEHLEIKGYIHKQSGFSGAFLGYLTYDGWILSDELQRSSKDNRTAFMAMQYGDPKMDNLFTEVLKLAIADTGFELRRLDEQPQAGIIDNLLRVEIRKAKFLIADLSTDNRGAYWEAGFAEGLDKEVIYICTADKFKEVHFDTNHCQTVPFDWNDLDAFKKQLKATIRATFPADAKMEDE